MTSEERTRQESGQSKPRTPQSATDVSGPALLAIFAFLTLTGCRGRSVSTVPDGELNPKKAQLSPTTGGGLVYSNAADGMSMPVPADFQQSKRDDPKENNTVHLGNVAKTCQVLLLRVPGFSEAADHQGRVRDKLVSDGHEATIPEPGKLGSYDAAHMHVRYASGVTEEFYTVQKHGSETTLITVHGTTCTADFRPTVQGFQMN